MTDVSGKTGAVSAMHAKNVVVRALLGGTGTMRAAGKAYLPQWPQEGEEAETVAPAGMDFGRDKAV